MKAGTVFDNPLMHFVAYGLANPVVVWALERGLYDEWCPGCRGVGFVLARPCACIEATPQCGERCGADGCPCCRSVCRECRGSRIRHGRPICAQDFGDEASLEVARRYLKPDGFAKNFDAEQLR